jgi:periplasmic divalent cation tolerance protein
MRQGGPGGVIEDETGGGLPQAEAMADEAADAADEAAEDRRLWVYMTAGDIDEARRIGRALVEERLAACVNVLPGMMSIYRWDDAIEEGGEVVLIAKSTARRLPALSERVRALHSYDCPCVVALPMVGGFAPFLEWIGAETDGAAGAG